MKGNIVMTNDLIFSPTTHWADAIRRRQISAREALQIHLAQIEKYNPILNAITIIDPEKAMEQALAADEALARGDVCGPLHGVPFTLKDAHSTRGMRTTVGFPPFAGYVPEEDSTVAARLKESGGVLIGKTNVPELLADYQTNNPLFGPTNNPWDQQRTSGGSSGGAAAALASGMTPFEIGSDLSSSIRIPAHFCGVFGLKPTERRVSLTGLIPNPQKLPRPIRIMSSIGPMARSVEDLELLYSIIAGPDGRDTEYRRRRQSGLKTCRLSSSGLHCSDIPGVPGGGRCQVNGRDHRRRIGGLRSDSRGSYPAKTRFSRRPGQPR
jgi:amidase